MQKSGNPDVGVAGGLFAHRYSCSLREVQSPQDPATFESYVELMRQGAAGVARVEAAARILQREAHRVSITAKAAMGALFSIAQDPFYSDVNFEPVKPLEAPKNPFKKGMGAMKRGFDFGVGESMGIPSPAAAAVAAVIAATNHVSQIGAVHSCAVEVARSPREAATAPHRSLHSSAERVPAHRRAAARHRYRDFL
mmetsp:Transcript_95247/g.179105  ORF Transcript_95247/g.179105 Transcript_95247/m.179105 type:complete len:196 (+) Transcript_95247:47-634(+)